METIKQQIRLHSVKYVHFTNDYMILSVDGAEYKIQLADVSHKLFSANENQRNDFEISPAGYGIHWRLLDEDLSIDGLLKVAKRN